jgi:eukaryotic-like serine/threonine-protein kinase
MDPCPTESELVAFREDALAETAASRLEAHLDDCEDCRTAIAELFRADAESGEPTAMHVGKFIVLGTLGAGGMGLVYSAYDPDLDRKVALKVLRPHAEAGAESRRQRVLAEARAMARLSHPNVLHVFEVGDAGGRAFIAMEYVDGKSLDRKLKPERPAWRSTLRLFQSAGRGLEAAHAAGLAHGDFKPQNVLVSRDGQVKVADFGLAATDSTVTSAASGTLRYLAPERLGGRPVDSKSDQFSFCVALYDALYGEHPFDDSSAEALVESLRAGRVRSLPRRESGVPNRLRHVLLRGLSADPAARFASMGELLRELDRDPTLARRRTAMAAAAILAISAVGWGIYRAEASRSERCAGARQQLDGVWDADRRSRAERAFSSAGAASVTTVWPAARQALDAYTDRWASAHREACEAAQRGERSGGLLDKQMACFESRRQDVRALTDLWLQADPQVAAEAGNAVSQLPSLASCSDTVGLAATVPPPGSAIEARRVLELREKLARARALSLSGKFVEGLAATKAAHEAVRTLGYAPLSSESWLLLGQVEFRLGAFSDAREAFVQSAIDGERGRDDEATVKAWTAETEALTRLGQFADSLDCAKLAEAALSRIGPAPELEAALEETRGKALLAAGDTKAARKAVEASLALRERLLPPGHPAIASSWKTLGQIALREGEAPEAVRCLDRALDLREKALGPDHPDVATILTTLGNAHMRLGDDQRAEALLRRALDVRRRGLAANHPDIATSLVSLAELHAKQGRVSEALGELQGAVDIRMKALGPSHPSTLEAENALQHLRK